MKEFHKKTVFFEGWLPLSFDNKKSFVSCYEFHFFLSFCWEPQIVWNATKMVKGVEGKINNSQKLLTDTSTLTIIALSKNPQTQIHPNDNCSFNTRHIQPKDNCCFKNIHPNDNCSFENILKHTSNLTIITLSTLDTSTLTIIALLKNPQTQIHPNDNCSFKNILKHKSILTIIALSTLDTSTPMIIAASKTPPYTKLCVC